MAETDVLYEFGRNHGFLIWLLALNVLICYTTWLHLFASIKNLKGYNTKIHIWNITP